jgi:hypothetical protein
MYVSLDLVKQGTVVEHQEAVAGVEAGGEDLFELTARKNDDLQRELSRRAASLSVDAHKAAPFIGVFSTSADSLQGAEVRATAHEGLPKGLMKTAPAAPPPIAPVAPSTTEAEAASAKRLGHVAAKVP